jgi:hypothetical protein
MIGLVGGCYGCSNQPTMLLSVVLNTQVLATTTDLYVQVGGANERASGSWVTNRM